MNLTMKHQVLVIESKAPLPIDFCALKYLNSFVFLTWNDELVLEGTQTTERWSLNQQ
jgi:hypothetical protein